jgi:hypothetical protein
MRRRTDKRRRSEAYIRRDLAERLEGIVRGFEEQVARDAAEDAEAARYFTNWPVN